MTEPLHNCRCLEDPDWWGVLDKGIELTAGVSGSQVGGKELVSATVGSLSALVLARRLARGYSLSADQSDLQ